MIINSNSNYKIEAESTRTEEVENFPNFIGHARTNPYFN